MANRLNYYFRQKVTESELDEGFDLLEQADRAFATDLALIGVVTGMAVAQRGAGANLTVDVAAGSCYDKDGERIQFSTTQNVDVSVDENAVTTAVTSSGNSKIISVFAKFTRVLTDPRTDGNNVTVFFNVAEGFEFVVRQSAEATSPTAPSLDPDFILLADITRAFGATTIVTGNISTARREDMFVRSGATYSMRTGRIGSALQGIIDNLNTEHVALAAHISNATAAHAASAISYAGSPNWADGSAITSTNVEAALDEVVSDLITTTVSASGAEKIGAPVRTASFLFGLASGTIGSQLLAIQAYLDAGPLGKRVITYTHSNTGTVLTTERVVNVDTTGGVVTLQLPTPVNGREFKFKDSKGNWGTSTFTLAPSSTEKIEGVAASRPFQGDWSSPSVFSDGTDWFIG